MKLKQNKAKNGFLMLELMLLGVLVSGGTIFLLSKYLQSEAKALGVQEAHNSNEALLEAIVAHPINSMMKTITTGVSTSEHDIRKNQIERIGFNVMDAEYLDSIKKSIYKNSINTYKNPVTITADFQFFSVESKFRKKETCHSFVVYQAKNTNWQNITINGNTLKLDGASPKQLTDLCKSSTEIYEYKMQYCFPTAVLPCN